MIVVELTDEQHDTLIRLATNKAKEIWGWKARLSSSVRDQEYSRILDALDALRHGKRGE